MAGIYVHIPFCHAKCAYCDFFSTPRMSDRAEAVARGIVAEYAARRHDIAGEPLRTVYFGGGTPSCLPQHLLAEICAALPMHDASECTIEVNPEDVTAGSAAFWRSLGFNRVSMGVQSLHDDELRIIARRHTAAEALQAIATLQAAGFSNISCDLIYGLPAQTPASWSRSLDMLLATGITHLSAYCLSYEPGTRLSAMLMAGKIEETPDDVIAEMYATLCHTTRQAGFCHYEISNFAKPDLHSRHNSAYWHSVPYLGLGPAAHSCDTAGTRRAAPSDISLWLTQGTQVEEESATDRINDTIITGLRTAAGLDLAQLPPSGQAELMKNARRHLLRGTLRLRDTRLLIPEEHWLVSDAILRDLLLD